MPNIDGLKAWAGEHDGRCDAFYHHTNPCMCDAQLKKKLVAEIEDSRALLDAMDGQYTDLEPVIKLEDKWPASRKAVDDYEL